MRVMIKIFEAQNPNNDAELYSSWDGRGSMYGGKYIFTANYNDISQCKWLTVIDPAHGAFYTRIPKERRILFIAEPPEILYFARYYLEQFGTIISTYNISGLSANFIVSNPHLGWWAGKTGEMNSYEKALNYAMPMKEKTISIISSLKHRIKYHRRRIKFMNAAKKYLGNILDCYGREINPVNDKLEAIAKYKYHIVIENSRHKNYWTEKLTDAWAGYALPIYFGDPDILSQVPDKNGLEVINIDDIPGALKRVREIIDSDIYYSRLEAIKRCRQWALKESNRYEKVCEIIESSQDNTPDLKKPELLRINMKHGKIFDVLQKISPEFADKIITSYCRHKKRIL